MRVKTVPRHLPRRFAASIKSVFTDDSQVVQRCEAKCLPQVKTVNFTTVEDIVEQVDQGICKQEALATESCMQWSSFPVDEVLDLSTKSSNSSNSNNSSSSSSSSTSSSNSSSSADEPAKSSANSDNSDKFKDTYLYQLMTDPNFLQQVKRESRVQTAAAMCSRCPYCKKEFGSESEVKVHLNVSADEQKQLSCCACGKSFAQKRYLRYHQRSHSERSKYSCDICTRKYSRLDNLTRHNIFHTNPDKFPCNSCERTFARKDLLNKHLKCHENKYKYHCDICQKYFKGPVSLENHCKLFHAAVTHGLHSASSFTTQSC